MPIVLVNPTIQSPSTFRTRPPILPSWEGAKMEPSTLRYSFITKDIVVSTFPQLPYKRCKEGFDRIRIHMCLGESQSRSVRRIVLAWLHQIRALEELHCPNFLLQSQDHDGNFHGGKMRLSYVFFKGAKGRNPNIIEEVNRITITNGPGDVLEEIIPAIRKRYPKRGVARSCNRRETGIGHLVFLPQKLYPKGIGVGDK
ncbi:hypothetical protein V6N11_047455 [Hibiscus sabdariffa]|uniref:Uncharacterized protein n=1 Tax=Hibiscus sabdariffa TaxID=183260 RepID=A0ABR2A8Z5_9ROSI